MAVQLDRSWMSSHAPPRSAARRIRLQALVLPVRRQRGARGEELLRVWPAEYAWLPRAQDLARLSTGGGERIPADDRGRHRARAPAPRIRREAGAARARLDRV